MISPISYSLHLAPAPVGHWQARTWQIILGLRWHPHNICATLHFSSNFFRTQQDELTPDTEAAHVGPLHDTMDTDSPHESDLRLSWAQPGDWSVSGCQHYNDQAGSPPPAPMYQLTVISVVAVFQPRHHNMRKLVSLPLATSCQHSYLITFTVGHFKNLWRSM